MIDCIICKKKQTTGEFAPENWILCVECLEKGYRICEADKKIFNVNEKTENSKIDIKQTFKIGEYDLLEDVAKRIRYDANKVCNNKCYNSLYINECIAELQMHLNMIELEETLPVFKAIKSNEEKRQDFIIILNRKIGELESIRQEYI